MSSDRPGRFSRSVVLASITAATFTDLVAYSVAVPVLPDYAARFNASPTVIGLLFASFGVTLLVLSIPMGALSDRVGRKGPMIAGLGLLAVSTLAFAYAESLAMLFAARLIQGAADGMTWIVGFAMIADLYGPDERPSTGSGRTGRVEGRGRAMGLVMAGSTLGIIIGPVIGGWLYEVGGIRLPFLFVSALAAADLIVFAVVAPRTHGSGASVPLRRVLTHRPVAICALVVVAGGGTLAMLEPVIPLALERRRDLGPAAIGTLFGIAAVVSTTMHPVYGWLSDRFGGRRLMIIGLVASAAVLPLFTFATDFRSAALAMVPMWMVFSMIVTPSLTYMSEVASAAGFESYGVVYGVYNMAWAVGLMVAPALGGFLFDRVGLETLLVGWGILLAIVGLALARVKPE
ncbi:MAG: MFS transporter [Acidobacteria bacterium]|nr:MAG: MFS transporter [Acidobacteriota bacterium]